MIPGARIEAAIDLLSDFEASLMERPTPADALVRNFFRARRYAGSKDRRFVISLFYNVLRNRQQVLDWLIETGHDTISTRLMMLAFLAKNEPDLLEFFDGIGHGPAVLSEEEQSFVWEVQEVGLSDHKPIQLNCPDWLYTRFSHNFGDDCDAVLGGLNGRATLDFRVNLTNGSMKTAKTMLADDGLETTEMSISPNGLRSSDHKSLALVKAYNEGFVDVQDESAQVAVQIVNAKPGMTIVDLCAGAGGKALGIADIMNGEGTIYGFDINQGRINDMGTRAKRAGVNKMVQARKLPEKTDDLKRKKTMKPLKHQVDRVVVDVPCSGTGTWRRNPDQRFHLTEDMLAQVKLHQTSLLKEGGTLVKHGGFLVYMTCSLLREENEDRVEEYLDRHPDFKLIDYKDIWGSLDLGDTYPAPKSLSGLDGCLLMAPHSHGTDGFFVAVLQRVE
jgi:16S rRNA (cytosine967-C5)-methyltransferase